MSRNFNRVFEFEKDFGQDLRCVPMAVRLKLDLAGIKLSLKEWFKLSGEERHLLLELDCSTEESVGSYRERVQALVLQSMGSAPGLFPPEDAPLWRDVSRIPEDLAEKARAEKIPLSLAQWAGFSDLERFALVKLSRPHHENKNFIPAVKEFGLLESVSTAHGSTGSP